MYNKSFNLGSESVYSVSNLAEIAVTLVGAFQKEIAQHHMPLVGRELPEDEENALDSLFYD
jgi:hypothetical protein